jgi:hypothetical protein
VSRVPEQRPGVPIYTPAPLTPRGVPAIKCPGGGALIVQSLSPTPLFVTTHWEWITETKGRDRPCCGGLFCPFCKEGRASRWGGWIAVWVPHLRTTRIFCLTQWCWEHSAELRGVSANLRGQGLQFERVAPGPRAAILAKLVSLPKDTPCPPEPCMEAALGALWGMSLEQVEAWRAVRRALNTPDQLSPPTEEESF